MLNRTNESSSDVAFDIVGCILSLGLAAWGMSGLIMHSEAQHGCGQNVFVWSIISVIGRFLFIWNSCCKTNRFYKIFINVMDSFLIIFAFIIWEHDFNQECRNTWEDQYATLYWYYVVSFWLYVAVLCILGICLIVSLVYVCIGKKK